MKKTNKGAAKLRQIVAKARQIHKSKPGLKWTTCIKQAAKK